MWRLRVWGQRPTLALGGCATLYDGNDGDDGGDDGGGGYNSGDGDDGEADGDGVSQHPFPVPWGHVPQQKCGHGGPEGTEGLCRGSFSQSGQR